MNALPLKKGIQMFLTESYFLYQLTLLIFHYCSIRANHWH